MDNKMRLPLLLTMGDPAGVGPEIAVKALCGGARGGNIVVVGGLEVMKQAAEACGLTPIFNIVDENAVSIAGTAVDKSGINLTGAYPVINIVSIKIDAGGVNPPPFPRCAPDARGGGAAYQYIVKAIELAMAGKAAGVVTGPISKESLKLAGINYPGHTEIFADKTGTSDYSMVFLLDGVAVAHVTTHVSLRNAIEMVTEERVLRQIRLLHRSLAGLGIAGPKMAVSGLNPHAGENGLFGDEEIREIVPAVNKARGEGIEVVGPLPPDTVFNRAFKGEFNGVVSMLHDHGFVALKSRDFEHGVNITVGLPIIRTSVGHGTAFDIAWKGRASCESLLSAIRAAESLYEKKLILKN